MSIEQENDDAINIRWNQRYQLLECRRQKVIAPFSEALKGKSDDPAEWKRLMEIFASPSLQMVSFTITAKGYALENAGVYMTDRETVNKSEHMKVGLDEGMGFVPDPMNDELTRQLAGISLKKETVQDTASDNISEKTVMKIIHPILSNANIFGIDLYEAGIGQIIEKDFLAMLDGPGAVRKTLEQTFGR